MTIPLFFSGKRAQEVIKALKAENMPYFGVSLVKEILGTLKSLKQEVETLKLVPAEVIKQASSLIKRLEQEMPQG